MNGDARNADLRTGVFMALGIAAFVGGVVWLPDAFAPAKIEATARFPFSSGVQGVHAGTPIYLGGLEIGSVKGIKLMHGTQAEPDYFEMVSLLNPGTVLPRTATVGVERSITGSEARIVVHLPPMSDSQAALAPGEVLEATPIRSTMEQLFGSERAANLAASVEVVRHHNFATNFNDFHARWQAMASASIDLKNDMGDDWEAWRTQASAILDGYDRAKVHVDRIEALTATGQPLDRERLGASIEKIRGNLSQCSQMVADLKTHWDEQILPPLSDMIDRFSRDLERIKQDYQVVRGLIDEGAQAAAYSRADLAIAGDQLTRAITEITLMPWVLLGGALEDKGEQAQFQKLSREIVRASAELHMAMTTARTLLEHDPRLGEKYPELMQLMRQWMDGAAQRNEEIGNDLLDKLIGPHSK